MKRIIYLATVSFLAVFVSLAFINTSVAVETVTAKPVATEADPFYIGISGGYAFGPDFNYDPPRSHSYDLDIQNTWVAGAKIGYTMPYAKFFAVELEYIYFGPGVDETILYTSGEDYFSMEGDLDIHNFMMNFIAKYPHGRVHPFTGLGLGFSYVDFTVKDIEQSGGVTSTYSNTYDDTSFAWQVFAGVKFTLHKNLSLDLAYRYFMTNSDGDYYYDDDYYYERRCRYRTDVKIKSNIVTVGLNFHF